jgi:hypothetical protein
MGPCPLHLLLPRHRAFQGQGSTLATCLFFGVQLIDPISNHRSSKLLSLLLPVNSFCSLI